MLHLNLINWFFLIFSFLIFFHVMNLKTFNYSLLVMVSTILVSICFIWFSYFFSMGLFLVVIGAFLVVMLYIVVVSAKEKNWLYNLVVFLISVVCFFVLKKLVGKFSSCLTMSEFKNTFLLGGEKVGMVIYFSLILFFSLFVMSILDVTRFCSLRKNK